MFNVSSVDKAFVQSKTDSKEALDDSRRAIDEAEPAIKEQHQIITNKKNQYKAELKAAEASGSTPPSSEGVDLRTSDELENELERQQAQLEITLNTNPGVMEEYEKRKRDVSCVRPPVSEETDLNGIDRSLGANLGDQAGQPRACCQEHQEGEGN